jgi:hypothetical protein
VPVRIIQVWKQRVYGTWVAALTQKTGRVTAGHPVCAVKLVD